MSPFRIATSLLMLICTLPIAPAAKGQYSEGADDGTPPSPSAKTKSAASHVMMPVPVVGPKKKKKNRQAMTSGDDGNTFTSADTADNMQDGEAQPTRQPPRQKKANNSGWDDSVVSDGAPSEATRIRRNRRDSGSDSSASCEKDNSDSGGANAGGGSASRRLTGGTNQNMLQGNIEHRTLDGTADNQGGDLRDQAGAFDRDGRLQGNANQLEGGLASQDPDAEDQELSVEWDKWRNRFLTAVQYGVQESLNNPDDIDLRFDPRSGRVVARFPLGTVAWFGAKITNDRRITVVKLLKTSGYPNYDEAVLNAVRNLQGSSILKFPARSRRQSVTQGGGIKTAETSDRQFFKFGDVERYRVPGN